MHPIVLTQGLPLPGASVSASSAELHTVGSLRGKVCALGKKKSLKSQLCCMQVRPWTGTCLASLNLNNTGVTIMTVQGLGFLGNTAATGSNLNANNCRGRTLEKELTHHKPQLSPWSTGGSPTISWRNDKCQEATAQLGLPCLGPRHPHTPSSGLAALLPLGSHCMRCSPLSQYYLSHPSTGTLIAHIQTV